VLPPSFAPDPSVKHSGNERHRQLLSARRVKSRLALLTLLVVVPLTGLLLLLVNSVFGELTPSVTNDLRWKAQRGAAELSHIADLGVLTGNQEHMTQAAGLYTSDRDFLYVAFHDAENKPVFERGDPRNLPPVMQTAESLSENALAYASWAPMDVEGLRVGTVTLAVSKERVRAGDELYRRMILVGLLGALVALGLALVFVRLYITPILQLTERTFVELERSAELALASAKAKSQFLANMSHEIRTPMNGVFGMLHLVLQTELLPAQRRYLDVISASAKSLLKIVNDVLDFSKLDAEKYQLVATPCSVRELVEQTLRLFEQKAAEKRLELRLRISKSAPDWVNIDGDRFRQVLSNLLSNAVKFTDHGWVEVRIGPGTAAADGKQNLEVSVQDTGAGIDESALPHLFRAFSQVDSSSTRAHEGTGLGLAISRKLTELMGGRLDYQRPTAGGSCFQFTLAVSAVPAAPVLPDSVPTEAVRFSSEYPVLLVDDNEINQIVAVEILEKMGVRVDVAGGGREAVEVALCYDYALILMDCQMPEVDGYQAAREIREREQGRRIPIVAFTAHALAEERSKVLAAGMDDYLVKPIEPDALQRVLSRFLKTAPAPDFSPTPGAPASRSAHPERDADRASQSGLHEIAPLQELSHVHAESLKLEPLNTGFARPARAVELFLTTIPRQLQLLHQAAADGRNEDVRTIAHKLKGSSGSLGAMRMSALCEHLQQVPDSATREEVMAQLVLLDEAHGLAAAMLQTERSRQQDTS
jgi:signal transduction histidine kinase/DNA-binding response OmpR family regulator